MISHISKILTSIKQPRFNETERGFQGEFLALLRETLPEVGLPGDAIVEQEYQKRIREHGITLRSDISVHIPAPVGGNRRRNNFRSCCYHG